MIDQTDISAFIADLGEAPSLGTKIVITYVRNGKNQQVSGSYGGVVRDQNNLPIGTCVLTAQHSSLGHTTSLAAVYFHEMLKYRRAKPDFFSP